STVTLTIAFTGRIQAWDQGGIYTNDKSESTTTGIGVSATQGVLLTHFEVSLARLAFPCPDDPQQYRLIWQLQSLQLPSLYSLVTSNTSEIMKKTMGNKGIQYSFAPIGPLPAYVLAFAAFSGSVEVVETTLHTRKPLSTLVEDNNKNNNNKCNTMGIRNYNNVETILPLRVITSKTSGVSLSMLNQIAYIAQEAVRLLEDFFAAPLPLQQLPFSENFEHQEEMLTIVVAPTMPYISGMEHHSCIFLNETIYRTSQNNNNNNNSSSGSGSSGNSNNNNNTKGSSKQQATSSDEVSRVELIVHELAHHWVGNALGMPFVLKEGVCLLLEQCFCDIIMGKPMRKIKPSGDTLSSTFITPAPSVSTTSSRTESSLTVSTATTVVDTEKGKEFTGYSYQKALNTLRDVVSRMGFSTFKERMQYMYFNEVMKHSENCGEEDYNSHFSVKDYLTPYVRADEFLAYMGT
ncbi:putative aminopeptidase, putative,metallo-peptidase, clan MA(E), family M1, partial [Trypanosoma theileri]